MLQSAELTFTPNTLSPKMISTANKSGAPSSHQQAASEPPPSRVVAKPVPAALQQDPRTYQINQLRKRFSPQESTIDNGAATSLVFKLRPSDPDFPFELDHLKCELKVPKNYPKEGAPPRLTVLNDEIPRGFAINVEKGWGKLVEEKKGATLLALTNALDKHLEEFLSEQKAETVKVTIYKDTRHVTAKSTHNEVPKAVEDAQPPAIATHPSVLAPPRPYIPEETFTKEQIAEAKARRAQETRQIETRMGRLGHYHKSSDGIVYTLPLEPKRRSELPAGLRNINSLQLIVPLLYPLQPLRILLNDVESADAEDVEELFVQKAKEKKELTLMSHINSLTQSIHLLAKQAQKQKKSAQPVAQDAEEATATVSTDHDAATISKAIENKGNVQVIPRPPEWYSDAEGDHSGEESYESTDSEDEDEGAALPLKNPPPTSSNPTSQPAERGTAISFPSVELHGIELLQVSILSLSVKCERCKMINEIGGLKPDVAKTSESCRKCATPFSITFRPELVHANSTRAGFIDLSGCTVADMLPSTFIPTCGKCSTATQGLVAVRADTTTNVCRECHARFTFKIPEVKFLAYSAGSVLPPTTGPRRRQEKLGLHAGEQLPDRGACKHYRKSYRWFRFSCCSKVHPCDKCHDDAENHLNEWANRMICGYCSREQNYAVANCNFCGRSVVGRKGRGFWEGGKGTRDQKLMSRKDPRKFKRIGGGETKKD